MIPQRRIEKCGTARCVNTERPLTHLLEIGERQAAVKATRTVFERFMSHVDTTGGTGSCWPWMAARGRDGYGLFSVNRRTITATRWLLGYLRGKPLNPVPSPHPEYALHHCDNPPCCNPDHLYVGTAAENMRDMEVRQRSFHSRQTHCKHGHRFDEANTRITRKGRRACRKCAVIYTTAWQKRNGRRKAA